MKKIQPIAIWFNGAFVNANYFNLISDGDNLQTSASFIYVLYANEMDMQGNQLANGQLTMDGQSYIDYSTNIDSNSFAYSWAAEKLNLILL